jgi:Protein of unknown function (DUF4238)
MDIPDIDPDPFSFEKGMSRGENQFDQVISLIEESDELPGWDSIELDILLTHFAKMHVSNPSMRDQLSEVQTRQMSALVEKEVADPERFMEICRSADIDPTSEGITHEDIRRFLREKKYTLEVDKVTQIMNTIKMIRPTCDILKSRFWSLRRINEERLRLITSDCPLLIITRDPSNKFKPNWGSATLTIPLTPKLLMVGTIKPTLRRQGLSVVHLAMNNTAKFLTANRHSFSENREIIAIQNRRIVTLCLTLGELRDEQLPQNIEGDESLQLYLEAQERKKLINKFRRK